MFTAEQIHALNELEMNVYTYIMQHIGSIPYMRIRELAEEAHVSTTTILHFCKKMGCGGYSEFKWRLKELSGQKKIEKVTENQAEIKEFFNRIDAGYYEQKLETAAAMIACSDRVCMVGMGNSGSIGEYAARCFTNLGKFTLFVSDPFYPMSQIEAAATVVIVLSVSGSTDQIIRLVNQLKQTKCRIISITGTENCTVAKLSDLNIAYGITMHRNEDRVDFTSQIPAVCLIETLGRRIRNRLVE